MENQKKLIESPLGGEAAPLMIPMVTSASLDQNEGTQVELCADGGVFRKMSEIKVIHALSSPPACRSSSLSISLPKDNLLQYSYEKFLDLSFYSSDGPPLLHSGIKLSALHCHFFRFLKVVFPFVNVGVKHTLVFIVCQ